MFCPVFHKANAQVSFKIEELWLSHYNVKSDSIEIDEDKEDGPYVYAVCHIINEVDSSIVLQSSTAKCKITFRYNSLDYEWDVVPLFSDEKKLILPKDTIIMRCGTELLLGTDIFNCKKGNYMTEMLQILPTVKVTYQDDKIKMCTSEVRNVILKK